MPSKYHLDSYHGDISYRDLPTTCTPTPQPLPPSPSPISQEALLTLVTNIVKQSSDDIKDFVTKKIESLETEKGRVKDQKQEVYYDKQGELLKSISCRIDTLESKREEFMTQPTRNRIERCCAIFEGAENSFDNALYEYDDYDEVEEPILSYEDTQDIPPVSKQNENSMHSLLLGALQVITQKLDKLERRVDEISIKQEQNFDSSWQNQDINEVSFRSGKKYEPPLPKSQAPKPQVWVEVANDSFNIEEEIVAPKNDIVKEPTSMPSPNHPSKEPPPYIHKPSLLHGLPKEIKVDEEFEKFMRIDKAPKYKESLKGILSSNRAIDEVDLCTLNQECSALFSKKLQGEVKDPGQFTIPCSIGDITFPHPLVDLGASVSIMPYVVYQKLGLGTLRSSKITLQLADGTTRATKGVIENVLIKIDEFFVPCDFIVMNMGGHRRDSLILGRPFLATTKTKINVKKGKLKMKICGETLKFKNPKRIAPREANAIEKKEPPKSPRLIKKKLAKMQEDDDDPFIMWLASIGHPKDQASEHNPQTPTLQREHSSNKEASSKGYNSSKDPG